MAAPAGRLSPRARGPGKGCQSRRPKRNGGVPAIPPRSGTRGGQPTPSHPPARMPARASERGHRSHHGSNARRQPTPSHPPTRMPARASERGHRSRQAATRGGQPTPSHPPTRMPARASERGHRSRQGSNARRPAHPYRKSPSKRPPEWARAIDRGHRSRQGSNARWPAYRRSRRGPTATATDGIGGAFRGLMHRSCEGIHVCGRRDSAAPARRRQTTVERSGRRER